MNELPEVSRNHCISWSAVILGAVIISGISFLVGLFNTAIGLSAFTLSENGAIIVAVGGLVAISIGVICATFVGGYTAGFFGRFYTPHRNYGIAYGFATWTVALFISALFATSITSYIATYSDKISNSVFVVPENKANATEQVIVESTPTTIAKDQKTVTITATTSSLFWGAFSVFLLFFVGALSSCFGAYWAMDSRRNN